MGARGASGVNAAVATAAAAPVAAVAAGAEGWRQGRAAGSGVGVGAGGGTEARDTAGLRERCFRVLGAGESGGEGVGAGIGGLGRLLAATRSTIGAALPLLPLLPDQGAALCRRVPASGRGGCGVGVPPLLDPGPGSSSASGRVLLPFAPGAPLAEGTLPSPPVPAVAPPSL